MSDNRGRGAADYIAAAKAKAKATLHEVNPKLTKLELAFRETLLKDKLL